MKMGEGKCTAHPCLCVPLERRMRATDGDCAQHSQFGQRGFMSNKDSLDFESVAKQVSQDGLCSSMTYSKLPHQSPRGQLLNVFYLVISFTSAIGSCYSELKDRVAKCR